MIPNKAAPENIADIETIARKLGEMSIGTTLNYEVLTALIGREVRSHRHLLISARKQVEQETGALFEIVRDVGIKRLTADETADVGLGVIRKVRRAARRGVDRLGRVRVNDMDREAANKVIAHRSQLGAIALVADGRKSATLAKEAGKTGTLVPAGRVLDMFKS